MMVLRLAPVAWADLLMWQRGAIEAGQWWRLWTGQLLHLSAWHLILNGLGLMVFMLLCPVRWGWQGWTVRGLWLGAAVGLGLLWWVPSLHRYVGLSGLLHGMFVLGLWPQARQRDGVAIACLLYLVAKLGYEVVAGAPVSDEALIGGRVITQSHLFGALGAVIFLSGCEALTRLRAAVNVSAPDTSNDEK